MFEPFFTTKEVGKGIGAGSQHGLRLRQTVERTYQDLQRGGPRHHREALFAGGDRVPGRAGRRGRGNSGGEHGDKTILIVEDDALVREYVVTQISRFGYRTMAAGNAAEALAIIDGPERVDLLFTNVIMPGGMNGRQLATEAQKRRPELKVLYTSGYTENAIVHHGRLDAGVLLLPKPYISSDLARMIRIALAS